MTDTIEAALAFSRPEDVAPDPARGGLLRNASHAVDAAPEEVLARHICQFQDLSAAAERSLSLESSGFETIDLAPLAGLQRVLERIRQAGHLSEADAAAIRAELRGRSFRLAHGKRLRLLLIAPEGLIMRKAGPNGLDVHGGAGMTEMNGHDGAVSVHADQDVHGSPLRQIMRGTAPWLFRHESPDGRNRLSPFFVVNIWIPLQQVTRPLTLMDTSSLNRRRHQTCYAFSTDHFLERDDATRVNDLWTFLHDPSQRWYFRSQMDAAQAYVFNTLGTPHGSIKLPGEAQAEAAYRQLQAALSALEQGDLQQLQEAARGDMDALPDATTQPLQQACKAMRDLLDSAAEAGNLPGPDWQAQAEAAMDRVVRKSIELRAVAFVSPVWRPGAGSS